MSIIKCTECGNGVSNMAEKCPKCGCPVNISKKKLVKKYIRNVVISILIVLIIIGSAFLVWKFFISKDVYWKSVEWGMSLDEVKKINHGGTTSDVFKEDSEQNYSRKYLNYNNIKGTSTHFYYSFDNNELNAVKCMIIIEDKTLTNEEIIEKLQKYLERFYGEANIEETKLGDMLLQDISWDKKDKRIEIINFSDDAIILDYEMK